MASRALISYQDNVGNSVTLTIEQSVNNASPVYTKDSLVAWAAANTPVGLELTMVRWSPEFEILPLT